MIGLGIDTGGTYTDSALVDLDSGQVLEKAKALTTRNDLTIGIANSIGHLTEAHLREVKLVSVSTTLATNSVVEGKGSRVGLITCGHDVEEGLPVDHFVQVAGGHDLLGKEKNPLETKFQRIFLSLLLLLIHQSFIQEQFMNFVKAIHLTLIQCSSFH